MQNGTPWLVKFIAQVGFPIAVAVYLLGTQSGNIPSPITKVEAQQLELIAVLKTRTTNFDAHINDTHAQNEQIVKLLRVICRHTAADKAEQAECDR